MLQRPEPEPLSAMRGRSAVRVKAAQHPAAAIPAELLHAITELSRELSEAHTPGQVAGLIVMSACQILTADSAVAYLWDETADQLRLACSSDSASGVDPLVAPGESLAQHAFLSQQPTLVRDYEAWRKASRPFEPDGFCSAAAVPMRTRERAMGAVVVRFCSVVDDPTLLDVLSLLSAVGSAPLEAAALRDRLRENERLDSALRRMTQALAAHESEGRVLWLATRYAAQLLGAPMARLWLLEEDGGFVCAAADGYLEPDPIGRRLPPDCLAGLVLSTGTLNLPNGTAHTAWYSIPAAEQAGVRAYLGAPMRRAGRSLGVLTVMRSNAFGQAAEHLISTLADAAAAAVDNARALARSQTFQRALAEHEQRYRVLFDHSPVTVLGLDEQGHITSANPGWERLSGHPADSVLGTAFDSLAAESPARGTSGFNGPLRAEATARDIQLVDKQGRYLDVRATRQPVLVDNRAVGAYEFLQDASARQREEEVLRRRARQQSAMSDIALWALTGADLDELLQAAVNAFASALDTEFAALFELDSQAGTLTLRAAAGVAHDAVGHVILGTSPDSQAGYTLVQGEPVLVDDLTAEQRFTPGPDLLARGALSGVSVVVTGRGEPFGVLTAHSVRRQGFTPRSAAFARAFGHVLGLAITCRGSQEALYRREQEITALVEHFPDVVVRLDSALRFTFANSAIEWATGEPASAFIGAGLDALRIPDTMAHLVQLRLRHVFRNARAQTFDLPIDGPAGMHDYETHLIPELARDGSVESVLAIARDVTERRRVEALREEQQRQLLAREERLEQLLEQMVSAQADDQRRRAEIAKLEPLSTRERQVLVLLAKGWTNAQIARDLLVSPGTVKNHVSRILPKLGAVDRTQAAARAVELGLLNQYSHVALHK